LFFILTDWSISFLTQTRNEKKINKEENLQAEKRTKSLKSNHKIPAFPFTNVISFIPSKIQDLSQIKFFMKIYMSTVWAKNRG